MDSGWHVYSPFLPRDNLELIQPLQIYLAQKAHDLEDFQISSNRTLSWGEIVNFIGSIPIKFLNYQLQGDTIFLYVPKCKSKSAEQILEEAPTDAFNTDGCVSLEEMLQGEDAYEAASEYERIPFVKVKQYVRKNLN
ncbi:hypothetical protein KW791_02625 [Candidatus Parcubacteria bacterium]|nr:hypothetical protein [Candidatus Parcubacteria bacterium]